MKKIIISNFDDVKNPYYGGGGAYVVHELAKRLCNFFDVTVITGKYPQSQNEHIDGVWYERIGIQQSNPKISQIIFSLLLPYYVKKKSFDMWLESFTPPFSTNLLQLFTKKPVVGLVYMLSGDDMRRKYHLPFDKIENIGLKTYKYIITPTLYLQKRIAKINHHATIVHISNGIHVRKKAVSLRDDTYILYLGRIEVNQKGLDLLLSSYGNVAKKVKTNLVIAGSGEEKEEKLLDTLIQKNNLQKRVKRLNRVSGKEKERLLCNAQAVVIPSRFETFSLVALEAMSYGIPLLCFDIDGLQWIPSGAGLKVKAFDVDEFSSSLFELMSNPQLRKKVALAGFLESQKYNWDTIAAEYKTFLLRL